MSVRRPSALMMEILRTVAAASARGLAVREIVGAARHNGCSHASTSSVSRALRRLRQRGAVELHPVSAGVGRTLRSKLRRARLPKPKLRVSRVLLTQIGRAFLENRVER